MIIKVSGHQYQLIACGYDLEIGHFEKWLARWLSGGLCRFCALIIQQCIHYSSDKYQWTCIWWHAFEIMHTHHNQSISALLFTGKRNSVIYLIYIYEDLCDIYGAKNVVLLLQH